MNILIICDRYDWGGASKVAKSIHEMLINYGDESIFLYGYEKKGLPISQAPKNVVTASYIIGPHINFLSYNLIGKNIFPVKEKLMEKYFESADIIHIHNIHDYGFKYEQVFELINKFNKPVILTCHDDWFITGRCSLTNSCLGWQKGCNPCLNKNNYHKALFDFAAEEFERKTKLIKSVKRLKIVTLSNWLFENLASIYGNEKCSVICNGVNTSIFKYVDVREENKKTTLLLIASDFNDKRKTDDNFIAAISNFNIEIHTVGANSKYHGDNIINHGRKSSIEIAQMMNLYDYHLFLSKEDYNPLVVLESLCCGMPQLTFKSKAVKGMDIDEDCIYIEDYAIDELLRKLEVKQLNKIYCTPERRKSRAKLSSEKFSKEVMFQRYYDEYKNLLLFQ